MATELQSNLISLPKLPGKTMNGKLLRRPRANKKVKTNDDSTQEKSVDPTSLLTHYRERGAQYSPINSIGAPSSPPPSEISYGVHPDFPESPKTKQVLPKPFITKDNKRYVIDESLVQQRHVHPQTQGGHNLLQPHKPRGPDGMTVTIPPKKHQERTADMFEEDHLRYYSSPEFTLKHFIIRLSEVEKLDIDKVQSVMYSKQNYKKLTRLIAEQCLHKKDNVLKVNNMDSSTITPVSSRVPQKQLLLEMAALVKEQMKTLMNTNVKAVIKSLPKYSPTYPLGAAPHTEIVLYEEPTETSVYCDIESEKAQYIKVPRGVSTKDRGLGGEQEPGQMIESQFVTPRSQEEGPEDKMTKKFETALSLFQTSSSKQFQGTGRSFSPFYTHYPVFEQPVDSSTIASHEMAVLDSIICGGLALSLKAHFIDLLPDISALSSSLVYINLSFNCFTEFPAELFEIKQLRVLKLRDNPIRDIPPEISTFTQLRTFVISFCLISYLPKELFHLKELRFLDVSYNKLTFIPNEIKYLRKLKEFSLEGNQIPAMPAGALKLDLTGLRMINTFMHPLFWKDYTNNDTAQRLTDLAALEFAQQRLDERYKEIPKAARDVLKFQEVCDCCQGPLFGAGLRIIRPCSSIFGVKNLPFMFRCCSRYCMTVFLGSVDSLSDVVYDEDDDLT